MIAPSEKHLEDWIVANGMPLQRGYSPCEYLIGRQTQLLSGIADLIYANRYGIHVVELKSGKIDEAAVKQVLRYKSDLTEMWEYYIGTRAPVYPRENMDTLDTEQYTDLYGYAPVGAMLIGKDIDLPTYHACYQADIWVWLYDCDGTDYSFTSKSRSRSVENTIYGNVLLKNAMYAIYLNRLKREHGDISGMNLEGIHHGQ